jgi:hypothetical protein
MPQVSLLDLTAVTLSNPCCTEAAVSVGHQQKPLKSELTFIICESLIVLEIASTQTRVTSSTYLTVENKDHDPRI